MGYSIDNKTKKTPIIRGNTLKIYNDDTVENVT